MTSGPDGMMPVDDVRAAMAYIRIHRATKRPFDLAIAGMTNCDPARNADVIDRYTDAGMIWWIEGPLGHPGSFDPLRQRIRQGPPHQ